MKVEHDKVPVDQFTPGNTYQVAMNGTPLFVAEVLKFHGGCWATVKVTQSLQQQESSDYTPGMEFDIKVAAYELSVV